MTDNGMPDREKVIRAVETCFDSWIDKHRNIGLDLHEVERLKREALEMLKEQEAVEPKLVDVNTWTCGECGALIGWEEFAQSGLELVKYKFCTECGRAVKWG